MLLQCFYNSFEKSGFMYKVEGPERHTPSAKGVDAAAKERQSRITDLESFEALGLLERGQKEELAGLREAERATEEAKRAAEKARHEAEAALQRMEAKRPGGKAPGERMPPGEKLRKPAPAAGEQEFEEGFELMQENEAADILRKNVENTVHFYRSNPDVPFDALLDFLAEEYSVPRDKLVASGINRKSTDRAIADAVVKLAAAPDAGAGG